MAVFLLEGIRMVENNEFDIVVGFHDDWVYETRCGS
jgi:hypothetical protein